MNAKIEKNFNLVLESGWLLIFILSPLFFAPFVYGTWQIGEYFLFQILTEIILFVWLAKIIIVFLARRQTPITQSPSTQSSILPAVIFIVVLGLATMFSQSPIHSFWGFYLRKMGYVTWLHFFVFFLVLFFNLKTQKQVARIFFVVALTSAAVAIYGFFQIFGFDIFPWSEAPFFSNRIFSSLGQPNFLASWLLLSLPFIIWVIFYYSSKVRSSTPCFKNYFFRALFICLFFLSVFVLVLTQSRGGWIGFFFAFFFLTIIFAWQLKQKRLAVLLFIFFVLCCVFVVCLNCSYPLTSRPGDSFLVSRFKTLSQLSVSGELRLTWWRNSWDLIKQRPILGYGPETQHLNFVKYYLPEFAALETINTYPDRAHNDFFDMLLISGFLGLISYLFLIISAFYFGFKHISKLSVVSNRFSPANQRSLIVQPLNFQFANLCLLTALLGYLISLQFSFHVIPTAVYFWGYLAVILKIATTELRGFSVLN